MNPLTTHPSASRSASPVRQTLLIVVILLAGLAVGVFILRGGKPAPAGDEHAEKTEEKHGHEHGHGEHEGHAETGRVELSPEKLKHANLGFATAEPARLHLQLRVLGKVVPDEERLAHVSPRFAGVVRRVTKRLGENVVSGETLAVIESNESLQTYDLKAPLSGTIIERNAAVGEFAGTDKSLFTVADLGGVWVDFPVHQRDFPRLQVGQAIRLLMDQPPEGGEPTAKAINSTLAYLSPFGAENTQTMLARAHVPNEERRLRPGLFVTGEITVGEFEVPAAVREDAIQTIDGKEVIFVQEGDAFEARAIQMGRRDGEHAEVLSGLEPGDHYVTANAFLLKAEIGKEGAEHED